MMLFIIISICLQFSSTFRAASAELDGLRLSVEKDRKKWEVLIQSASANKEWGLETEDVVISDYTEVEDLHSHKFEVEVWINSIRGGDREFDHEADTVIAIEVQAVGIRLDFLISSEWLEFNANCVAESQRLNLSFINPSLLLKKTTPTFTVDKDDRLTEYVFYCEAVIDDGDEGDSGNDNGNRGSSSIDGILVTSTVDIILSSYFITASETEVGVGSKASRFKAAIAVPVVLVILVALGIAVGLVCWQRQKRNSSPKPTTSPNAPQVNPSYENSWELADSRPSEGVYSNCELNSEVASTGAWGDKQLTNEEPVDYGGYEYNLNDVSTPRRLDPTPSSNYRLSTDSTDPSTEPSLYYSEVTSEQLEPSREQASSQTSYNTIEQFRNREFERDYEVCNIDNHRGSTRADEVVNDENQYFTLDDSVAV